MTRNVNPTHQAGVFGEDVAESFRKLKSIIQKNGGKRQRRNIINNCKDADSPFKLNTKTHLNITSKKYDILQLHKGAIHTRLRIRLRSNRGFQASNGYQCLRLKLGLKNSNELLRQLEVYYNNLARNFYPKIV